MSSILVINAAGRETRVALVENGHIAEFYLERKKDKGVVGNIYKGRVVRVLPGMQAAFVDIGLDKAAFLYVSDVVYDPDFARAQFELTEGEHEDAEDIPDAGEDQATADSVTHHGQTQVDLEVHEVAPGELPTPAGGPPRTITGEYAAAGGEQPETTPHNAAAFQGESSAVTPPAGVEAVTANESAEASSRRTSSSESVPVVQPSGANANAGSDASGSDASTSQPIDAQALAAAAALKGVSAAELGGVHPELTGTDSPASSSVSSTNVPSEFGGLHPELLAPPTSVSDRSSAITPPGMDPVTPGAGAGTAQRKLHEAKGERRAPKDQRAREQKRHEEKKNSPKEHKIEELLKVGQEVVVQISKDPIGTKGARLTSHISIPGRHLVFMPTVDHVGISRRITNEKERRRLRDLVDKFRPPGTGFIVRTVAENIPSEKLESDIRFLIEIWNHVVRENEKRRGPGLLHADLDLILRATRDLFAQDVEKLVIDDRDEYARIQQFVASQDSALKDRVVHHDAEEPIFDAYGIEQEIQRAVQRKVWLKSGGYLIIDQAEALTAIDVNSGRYVGKKSLEETITKINVEAAKEIVYQLRLRNIGGIIICDFIDMEKSQNRDKVFKSLQEALGRDKAKTNVLKISELGLVEMTRKRVRESIGRVLHEDCAYCDGKGFVKTATTVAYEIFRDIRREAPGYKDPTLVVNCNHDVSQVLQNEEREELRHLMDRFNKSIQVKVHSNYHREQYDIYGRTAQGQDHKFASSNVVSPEGINFGLPPQRNKDGNGGGDQRRGGFRERGGKDRNRGGGGGGGDRGGGDRGGGDRGGADRGGADRGSADRGGGDRGGADRGGADRGGADRGGADRGGADRGGGDRGGADRGGGDRGGSDRGERGSGDRSGSGSDRAASGGVSGTERQSGGSGGSDRPAGGGDRNRDRGQNAQGQANRGKERRDERRERKEQQKEHQTSQQQTPPSTPPPSGSGSSSGSGEPEKS